MTNLLELLRIVAILVVLGVGGGLMLEGLYSTAPETEAYGWLGGIAVLLLIFVLYRNKLQFSGWYKGEGRDKLPRTATLLLISASIVLIVSPFVLGVLFA